MTILLSNKSNIPIYEQIKNQIKEQILNDSIKEGEFLPSIRQLAKELGISVITTTRAYSDLESEGFIATLRGKGSYVLPKDKDFIKEHYLKSIEELFNKAITESKLGNISQEELVDILKNLLEIWINTS